MILNMSGGGGAGLNFRILGGTSKPTSPKVNDIWVNTDAQITGFAFSANEPENVAEGTVWIGIDLSSEISFNLLKKNAAYTYPAHCKQLENGAWAGREAFFYDGRWVQFNFLFEYLYNNGETSLEWQGTGTDTATELIMGVVHTVSSGSYGDFGRKYTANKIVIPSGYTKLRIKYYVTGEEQTDGTPSHKFVLRTDHADTTWFTDTNVVASVSIPYTTEETIATMEISSALYGQELYVGTYYNSHKNIKNLKEYHIKEIWFE